MTASQVPDDAAQRLRDEIERTREQLGATVEEFAAKVDVKSRAQAKAAELGGQVTWQAKSMVAQARRLAAQSGPVRKHRAPLSAGVGAAGLLAAVAIIIWLRRKR